MSKPDKQPTPSFNLWRGINLVAAICMPITSAAFSLPGFRDSYPLIVVKVAEWLFFVVSVFVSPPHVEGGHFVPSRLDFLIAWRSIRNTFNLLFFSSISLTALACFSAAAISIVFGDRLGAG